MKATGTFSLFCLLSSIVSGDVTFPFDFEVINSGCVDDNGLSGIFRLSKNCETAGGRYDDVAGFIVSVGPVVCCVDTGSRNTEHKAQRYCTRHGAGKPTILDFHIAEGEKSDVSEFPFMVAIGYENIGETLFDCGGSLVSDKFILTAAHCLNIRGKRPTIVRMGRVRIFSKRF